MDVFAGETAPFAVALGLTLAIAFIELLGLILGAQPSAMVDSALPDFDTDIPDVELGPLSQSLSWLSFGKLPALVVLILISASFGLIGFAGQEALRRVIGFAINPWIASIPAAFGAAFVTRHAGLALARIMPKEESDAVSTKAFVGRVATVFRGVAAIGHPAEAKLTDIHGKTHYVLIEPDEGEASMPEGSEVVIISQSGPVFRAITKLKPAG
jgi:hypothetical protein